jgi:hypothetical protein
VRGRIILKCVLMEYVKLSRCKPCRCKERTCSLYLLLTSALYGGEVVSVTLRPRFTPEERTPGTHLIKSLCGPQSRS